MSAMATAAGPLRLSHAVVAFALRGEFPDDVAELPPVSDTDLNPAIEALAKAKSELEIHDINQETKDDVDSWVRTAKTLQQDVFRSKHMADSLLQQSEAPPISGEAVQDAEEKTEFLSRELKYSQQLGRALVHLQQVNQVLDDAELARNERRITDALRILQESRFALDNVGVSKTCRVVKLLHTRTSELSSSVRDLLDHAWKSLIRFDLSSGKVAIDESLKDGGLNLPDAIASLKIYHEVDERIEQFWRNLDSALLSPRMDTSKPALPAVKVESDELVLVGQADQSATALLSDLEKIFIFVARKLPEDLVQTLSKVMMSELVPRLIKDWLNPAVPSSLKNMESYQAVIEAAASFCSVLEDNGYAGFDELCDWVTRAPDNWLERCRETVLNAVRAKLEGGFGQPKEVEKIEKHMVSLSEGRELATKGAGAAADTSDGGADWADAWGDDEEQDRGGPDPDTVTTVPRDTLEDAPAAENDGADSWKWDEDDTFQEPVEEAVTADPDEDEELPEAWNWGEEDDGKPDATSSATMRTDVSRVKQQAPTKSERTEEKRELVLKETYRVSSMPETVLELIVAIVEDGAILTKEGDEHKLVAAAAPGLFGLPTLVLALFRAISPYYYSLEVGGNMFLYNDAIFLFDRLKEFAAAWKQRHELNDRAKAMLRFDNDIKTLQSFANRTYGYEMTMQKTVLHDLLGSSQSLMQQAGTDSAVESGTSRIRTMAAAWEPILARSVWSQAVGSLADALARRLIADVMDLPSIGQDEAYSIAKLIATVTELDDLFLPSRLGGVEAREDEVPTTSQYAPNWLRLKFLGEVLQSNLNEVKYLWCDSELSLHFTRQEVIDLVKASFEDNVRTRETIKAIQARPQPLAGRRT